MYKTYRATKDTIMAEKVESADLTVKLITDLERKEYVIVKRQGKVTAIKPRRRYSLKFNWKYFVQKDSTSS